MFTFIIGFLIGIAGGFGLGRVKNAATLAKVKEDYEKALASVKSKI